MEFVIGVLVGVIIICGLYVFIIKKKKDDIKESTDLMLIKEKEHYPMIEIIEDNSIIPIEKNKVTNSDIKNAITKIDTVTPNSILATKNIKNSSELLNQNKVFFSTSKKGVENMVKVKNSNKVYGTQAVKGKFKKQTKFTNENNLINVSGKNSLANASMSVVSMVVGQYYMNEINNKLDDIKNNIKEISDYLDSEYKSKLIQILSKMNEITTNTAEVIGNDYSRDKRYNEVLSLEESCSKLLGQANEMIKSNFSSEELNYKQYVSRIKNVYKWFTRQQLLQSILLEIGNLRNALCNGTETAKLSYYQYNNYLNLTNKVNQELENWNKIYFDKFGIEIHEMRKKGKLFTIRKNTIGKIKEEYAYDKLDSQVVMMISKQININKQEPYIKELKDKKIRIQKYNGEYYNLIEGPKSKS